MKQRYISKTKYCHIRLYVLLPVLVSMLLHISISCNSNTGKKQQSVTVSDSTSVPYIDSVILEFTGKDSLTVLQLLEEKHQVQKKSSALGVFINGIDSIENKNGFYWMYSVNDSMGKVACDKYVTQSGDRVKWVYRKSKR